MVANFWWFKIVVLKKNVPREIKTYWVNPL